MPKTRIPSPARSQGAPTTPRRHKHHGSRSVGSPARSHTSGRLTSVIQNFRENSFVLTPLPSKRSLLIDTTDIEKPRRQSWWKQLGETSTGVMEGLEENDVVNSVLEDLEITMLSQEQNNFTLDMPDSSDSGSISSIVVPQRKLFTQNDNQLQNKYSQLRNGISMPKLHKTNIENEKTINPERKNLFSKDNKLRSKPIIFPAELFKLSPNKTANKTKEIVQSEVQGPTRSLFGNRPVLKRKNMFADFVLSESEDEISEIQPRIFGFQKKTKQEEGKVATDCVRSASDGPKGVSPTNSMTKFDMSSEWKLLPSSTMVQEMEVDDDSGDNIGILTYSDEEPNDNRIEDNFSIPYTSIPLQDLPRQEKNQKAELEKDVSKKSINKSNKINHESQVLGIQIHGGEKDPKFDEGNQKFNEDMKESIDEKRNFQNISRRVLNDSQVNNNKTQSEDEQNNDLVLEHVMDGLGDKNQEIHTEEVFKVNNINDNNRQKNEHNENPLIDEDIEEPEDDNQNIQNICKNVRNESHETEYKEQSEDEHDPELDNKNEEQEGEYQEIVNKSEDDTNVIQESHHKQQDLDNDEEDSKIDEEIEESEDENNVVRNISGKDLNESQETENEKQSEEEHEEVQELHVEMEEQENKNMKYQNNSEKIFNISVNGCSKINKDDLDELLKLDQDIKAQEDENPDILNLHEKVLSESQETENDEQSEDEHMSEPSSEKEEHEGENSEIKNITRQSNYEEQDEDDIEQDPNVDKDIEEEEDENDDIQYMSDGGINEQDPKVDEDIEESEDENDDIQNVSDGGINESQKSESEEEAPEFEDEIEEEENEDIENENEDIVNVSQNMNEEQDKDDRVDNSDEDIEDPEVEHLDPNNENQDSLVDQVDQESETDDKYDGLDDHSSQLDSKIENKNQQITTQGRNTSFGKTKSMMMRDLSLKSRLAPPRESTGFSDGTKNSSAEGSGWDSHRVTRKTLRQTFGRDFTPRKSLRALVMEKSAKRHTTFNDVNMETMDMPRANSTEYPDASNRYDDTENEENPKTMSRAALEIYLLKKKEENLEKRRKMEEAIRNSLKIPEHDTPHLFRLPPRPKLVKQANKPAAQNKPKNKSKSAIPLDLPPELLEDLKYKPPKRYKPRNVGWVTKRLYKYLETKLEPKYDYKSRVRAEKLVETIYNFTKDIRRHHVAPADAVQLLKREMARLGIVKTHHQFYGFIHEFMPREVRVKVVPDIVNKIPLPRLGPFSDILTDGQG